MLIEQKKIDDNGIQNIVVKYDLSEDVHYPIMGCDCMVDMSMDKILNVDSEGVLVEVVLNDAMVTGVYPCLINQSDEYPVDGAVYMAEELIDYSVVGNDVVLYSKFASHQEFVNIEQLNIGKIISHVSLCFPDAAEHRNILIDAYYVTQDDTGHYSNYGQCIDLDIYCSDTSADYIL